jgi:hypothetical protein
VEENRNHFTKSIEDYHTPRLIRSRIGSWLTDVGLRFRDRWQLKSCSSLCPILPLGQGLYQEISPKPQNSLADLNVKVGFGEGGRQPALPAREKWLDLNAPTDKWLLMASENLEIPFCRGVF